MGGDGLTERRSGRTILVVDDDEDIRRTLAAILTRMQFRVLTAADGEEALKLCAKAEDIGFLLTDLIMPHMTGRMLADTVKELYPEMRVILMSGHITDGRMIRPEPGLRYLQKPVTGKMLAAAIAALMEDDFQEG